MLNSPLLLLSRKSGSLRSLGWRVRSTLSQEMNLFKCLSPLSFLIAAAAAQAQPPVGPLYDPQGRLIPYDVSTSEGSEAPRPAIKPKATKKKNKSKASATSADGVGKAKKGNKKGAQQARAKKPGATPSTQKKRAR
jgi:hypothetical protein